MLAGIHESKIMLKFAEPEGWLGWFAHREAAFPGPVAHRKDSTIFCSRRMPLEFEKAVLCGMSHARFGANKFRGGGEPVNAQYPAPEILLGHAWDNKADIWALGVMVSGISSKNREGTAINSRLGEK